MLGHVEIEYRRRLGAYDTPPHIVKLMIELLKVNDWKPLKVLEPACGMAPFSFLISKLKRSWRDVEGVDVNPKIIKELRKRYPKFKVYHGDYLTMIFNEKYDIIIGNPPYGIIGDESHYAISTFKRKKSLYKKLFKTWYGKYNIYGLFIEKSIKLLNNNGRLCFIVPATWMILDEFKLLRAFLARSGRIKVYYLGRNVFKGLNIVTVILIVEKNLKGLELYDLTDLKNPRLKVEKERYNGEIITFETELTRKIESIAKLRLGELFDIKISPRSPEIKNCKFLSKVKMEGYIPLLNGKNLKPKTIDYKTCYTGYYIKPEDVPKLRSWFSKDRIVVGHTKGGKLVAALESRHYAWTGDVYHLIPKFNIQTLRMEDIVEVLNSKVMNAYMYEKYREITPHTTKTQLQILPLLTVDDIKRLTLDHDAMRIAEE